MAYWAITREGVRSSTVISTVNPLQIIDFLRILFESQVSELLIIAGLVFLAIAIMGDISGRIQPGKHGRIAGGVIGSLLLISGLGIHFAIPAANGGMETETQSPTPSVSTPLSPEVSTPTPTPTPTPTLPPKPTLTPTPTPTPTLTPTPTPTETMPETADSPLSSKSIHWQGDQLWLKNPNATGGETYQIRTVTDEGDSGRLVRQIVLDEAGEAIIDTSSFASGTYVVVNQNGDPLRINEYGRVVGTDTTSAAEWEIAIPS